MYKKVLAGMLSVALAFSSGSILTTEKNVYAASEDMDVEEEIARDERTVFEELKENTEENDSFSIDVSYAGAAMAQEESVSGTEENGDPFSAGDDNLFTEEPAIDDLTDGEEGDWFETETEPGASMNTEPSGDVNELILQVQEGDDITVGLNALLLEAKEKASDQNPCKVVIPPGNYQITGTICMYSNIHLYAVGAVITKMSPKKEIMLRLGNTVESEGGYNGYHNVTIEGGTWDANYETVLDKEASGGFVGFRIGHVSHVVIKDVTFLNNLKSHFLEFAGVKDAKVTGCTFRGYWEPFEGGGQECIQIDACKDYIFPGYLPYDGSVCEDIYIEGNLFENVFSGVGSHSMVFDRPYKNIVIRGNTFRNIKKRAVWCLNYQDSVVENNVMTNVGGGVYVRSVYSPNTHLTEGQNAVNTGNQQPENIVVANNHITINPSMIINGQMWNSFGINIVGEKCGQTSGVVPEGTYFVRNITVKNNEISGPGNGLRLILARNCTLSGNIVNITPSEKTMNMGICLGSSDSNTITDNKIQCGKRAGIYVYKGNNIVTNNTVSGTSGDGIVLSTLSDGTKIEGNKVGKVPGTGILATGSKNITIARNTASRCGQSGIEVTKSERGTVISKNTSSLNKGIGILVNAGKSVSVTGNVVNGNSLDGIKIEAASTKSAVKSNACSKNKGYGILIYHSTNASVSGNKVSENYKDGIRIQVGSSAVISKNTVSQNKKAGIRVAASKNVSVTGNAMSRNSYEGIRVENSSTKVAVKSNTCSKNKGYGILIYSSTNATVSGNKVSENYKDGIRIHASSDKAAVTSNQSLTNKKFGIVVSGSAYVSVSKNKMYNNKNYGFGSANSSIRIFQQNQLKGNAYKNTIYLKNTKFPGVK